MLDDEHCDRDVNQFSASTPITKSILTELGWVEKAGIMVWFGVPRLGWKDDGTLIIGYYEYHKKVFRYKDLVEALVNENGILDYHTKND